jgi:Phospholipase_D-nuclease N-terminal
MARRRWSDLSEDTRRRILIGAAVEGPLKILALRDLRRRPAAQVRGPKWLWVLVLTVVNSVGAAPVAYLVFGRRQGVGGTG